MEKGRIAIPSMEAGGLDGKRAGHFGHCDTFTLVDVKDGAIEKISTIPNQDHVQGGCMVPVNLLAKQGQCPDRWRHRHAPTHGVPPGGHRCLSRRSAEGHPSGGGRLDFRKAGHDFRGPGVRRWGGGIKKLLRIHAFNGSESRSCSFSSPLNFLTHTSISAREDTWTTIADGWGGSMFATDLQDFLFETP
jgi:hypothetical protein